ncbi:MAG: zinc ribbon domain-containing protein [Oscillospiraceae bacterium]|nr:zinc ribbon domain-containing protein [Oscillospiraceae bacterium]
MKCPNCGAEIGRKKSCEFCGTQITLDMQRTQEQLNREGCPKCHSTNIQFRRENQGEIRGKKSKQVVHKTIGFCKDCGYTWFPTGAGQQEPKKNNLWLWVLGWIFIFPVPLTILMLRKKEMKSSLKYGIIAVAWIIYLIIGLTGNSSGKSGNSHTDTSTPTVVESNTITTMVTSEGHIEEIMAFDSIIENMVDEYNSKSNDKLTFVEDFVPSDKRGKHYRTEFRLEAYQDAIGKSYSLNGSTVDFVIHEKFTKEYDIRLYSDGIAIDECKLLISGFSPLLDPNMKASDIDDTIKYIEERREANGYYYGELGLLLLGNDNKGYELMIKTD